MKGKNLLMIGVGAVVLYFVWQKFGKNSSGSSNGEKKANARGRGMGTICNCKGEHGYYQTSCDSFLGCSSCCGEGAPINS